jgi:hypothetical protein
MPTAIETESNYDLFHEKNDFFAPNRRKKLEFLFESLNL